MAKRDCSCDDVHQGEGEKLAVVIDYTEQFTPDRDFSTREKLVSWVQELGRRNGLVIIIQNSDAGGNGRRAQVNFSCERYGRSKSPAQRSTPAKKGKRSQTGTKKCGCLFILNGKNPQDGEWTLKVACDTYNHPAAKFFEGHSYAGRLNNDEVEIMVQMSKSNARPKDILMTLKERTASIASTLKTVYIVK